ncbi:MAG: CPBP family glutamic-type intramembrane protease [Pseudomonadota bacterium]
MVRVILLCSLIFGSAYAEVDLHDRDIYNMTTADVLAIHDAAAADYDAAIAATPGDIVLHIRRCQIAARYSYFDEQSIDALIERADDCFEELERRFPGHPEMHLALLEGYRVDDVAAYATDLHDEVAGWNLSQHARLHVVLSNARRYDNEWQSKKDCAAAYEFDRSSPCSVEAAEYHKTRGETAEAIAALYSPLDLDIGNYDLARRIDLLVSLGANDKAEQLWRRLRDADPEPYVLLEVAPSLVSIGLSEDAESALADVPEDYWDLDSVLVTRFRMAVDGSQSATALEVYETLRDQGFEFDPLLRIRGELALIDGSLPWQWRDLNGVAMILTTILILYVFSLVPTSFVHYRGLVRAKQGRLSPWAPSAWQLSHLTGAFFVLALCTFVTTYLFAYTYFFEETDARLVSSIDNDGQLLMAQIGLMALFSLPLMIRGTRRGMIYHRGLRVLRWILIAIAMAIVARLIFVLLAVVLSGWVELAQIGTTQEAIAAAQRLYGFWPIFFVVAVVVPIVEEFLFRGVMLTVIAGNLSFFAANLIQSVLFASMHDSFWLAPGYIAFALIAGWMTRRTNSLLPAILMHAVFNASSFALLSYVR